MNVSLTPALEALISEKVQSGQFESPDEVVSEALRLLEQSDEDRVQQSAAFNAEIHRRLDAIRTGESMSGVDARARLMRKSQQQRTPVD